MDGFRSPPPDGVSYTPTKNIHATEIRVAKSKTQFYNFRNGKFIRRNGYLMTNDPIIITKENDQYSFVRFFNPVTTRVTTGWIRIADLVDPFPSEHK